jgi:CHAT domain-containing protein
MEEELGPDHPDVALSLSNLAELYRAQGRYAEAERFYQRSLEIRRLRGEPAAEDVDDGVLMAYEASTLDLQGTELVVLSACETGLGEQQKGEGVFGLRRGLQESGAEAVLMSMWSVPDRETQELMTKFYGHWLSGAEKHEALRKAQLEEREIVQKRYGKDLPYYWGAFVLVGR